MQNHDHGNYENQRLNLLACSMFLSSPFRYVDTVVGEKHVVLLLDMSGSMLGIASKVAQLAAIQLLNSLSVDDFFHVLRVDDNVTSLDNCFNGPVRASAENILAISTIISNTSIPYGQANFDQALQLAYTELNVSNSLITLVMHLGIVMKVSSHVITRPCNTPVM